MRKKCVSVSLSVDRGGHKILRAENNAKKICVRTSVGRQRWTQNIKTRKQREKTRARISRETRPPTVWPNASYSEKMPRHSGPYWVVVWTLPITSIPRAKCSTGKLGQNGLIWPFLRSFWLCHRISSFFHKWVDFFFWNWCQWVFFILWTHSGPSQEENLVKLT